MLVVTQSDSAVLGGNPLNIDRSPEGPNVQVLNALLRFLFTSSFYCHQSIYMTVTERYDIAKKVFAK